MIQVNSTKKRTEKCIKRESNPRRVDGNDPGYHYPINASKEGTGEYIKAYHLHLAFAANHSSSAI